jgi:hypothetical protein
VSRAIVRSSSLMLSPKAASEAFHPTDINGECSNQGGLENVSSNGKILDFCYQKVMGNVEGDAFLFDAVGARRSRVGEFFVGGLFGGCEQG